MAEQAAEHEQVFKAVTVTRRSLELLRPLVERFADSGASQWDSETLMRVAWDRLAAPLFRVWAVVRDGTTEPLGFAVAQVQASDVGTEVYILAAYMEPGLPLYAGDPLQAAFRRWAKAMGAVRMMARTVRGDGNGLAEPHAWERFGFIYDSTLLAAPLDETLQPEVKADG